MIRLGKYGRIKIFIKILKLTCYIFIYTFYVFEPGCLGLGWITSHWNQRWCSVGHFLPRVQRSLQQTQHFLVQIRA